jgi:hypothetical protein
MGLYHEWPLWDPGREEGWKRNYGRNAATGSSKGIFKWSSITGVKKERALKGINALNSSLDVRSGGKKRFFPVPVASIGKCRVLLTSS